jgi:very-short-patch-repair endonuclease
MTNYEFLKKAREVHGYKYQYPLLPNKITLNDRVDVLYNDTLYDQSVSKHLMGRSPEKNIPRKTTDEFIEEAKSIWGDRYDYSLVEYNGALKKVKIIYDGIIFEQEAVSHLQGLSPEFKMNLDYFIKKSKEKWGDKYDYSLVEYKNSKEKIKIIYDGKIYEQTPSNHLMYAPEKNKKTTTKDFIEKAINKWGDKYDYSLVEYLNNTKKIKIICPLHGEFEQSPMSHLQAKYGCGKCVPVTKKTPKYTTIEFIEEAKSIWGDKYDYSLVEYINIRKKIKVIYDDIVYEQTPGAHLKYPPERFLNHEIFMVKAKRKWGDKYDYSLVEFISTKIPIKIIYNGVTYEQLPSNHLIYAPELRNHLTLEDFIEKSNDIHNNKYDYSRSVYLSDKTKVTVICPLHGEFDQKPSLHMRGAGCPKCNDSLGEREISKYLDNRAVEYLREYKFDDCKNIYPLRFDFYIPDYRMVIEFDGIQHYEPISFFGGIKALEKLKINDTIKNNYCEENYINLIRIRYDEVDRIEKILKPYIDHYKSL